MLESDNIRPEALGFSILAPVVSNVNEGTSPWSRGHKLPDEAANAIYTSDI